jgi:hypothetical protein
MTKTELMKALELAVDDAIRTQIWGVLEITFKGGDATQLRQEKITRLQSTQGTTHAKQSYR